MLNRIRVRAHDESDIKKLMSRVCGSGHNSEKCKDLLLPIKPVYIVNIAFLFIHFFNLSVFFFKGLLPMLVWEEYHYPQAEKPNTYLRNDQVLTYYILFKLVFT
jgi:hypothetical protein